MLQLNYKVYGEGQPFIILHGFLGSLDNWHTLAGEFGKQGLKVYTIDQRNHGKSPHTTEHSIELMVEDLKDFMADHQLKDAIILGHSMGGKTAMQFALNYPELVNKLIIADMAPRRYKPGAHDDVFKAISNVDLSTIATRKEAEEAMSAFLGDSGTRQFILKSLERTEENGYRWKFNISTLMKEYDHLLKEITASVPYTGPVLFLKGELSGYIREQDHEEIRHLFPAAVIHSIPQSGHWLHADQPKLFYEQVISFVKGL